MLPRLGSKLITTWIIATFAVSVVVLIDDNLTVYSWVALQPAKIWHGQVWRLFTWVLIEPGPMSLIATCACIYKFGGELAIRWGDRRLRRFTLQAIIGGAAITALLAWFSEDAWQMYRGAGWAVDDLLVIAWARQFPTTPLTFFGFLTLDGMKIVGLTVGITVLMAIAYGPLSLAPELIACFAAAFYPRGWLARA